jgi:hypothetical protein
MMKDVKGGICVRSAVIVRGPHGTTSLQRQEAAESKVVAEKMVSSTSGERLGKE